MKRIFTIYFILSFLFLILIFLLLLNIGYIKIYKEKPVMQLIADMDQQNKISKDKLYSLTKEYGSDALPLKNNFPVSAIFYPFEPQEYSIPETNFKNPLPYNEIVLERGKSLFYRFCVPCHNSTGKGDGPVVTEVPLQPDEEGFPKPADLTSERAKNLSDGRLFHILSAGQNLMFSYHDKLSDFDKWCVIHYIRKLQGNK
jgi:hypothetical protein